MGEEGNDRRQRFSAHRPDSHGATDAPRAQPRPDATRRQESKSISDQVSAMRESLESLGSDILDCKQAAARIDGRLDRMEQENQPEPGKDPTLPLLRRIAETLDFARQIRKDCARAGDQKAVDALGQVDEAFCAFLLSDYDVERVTSTDGTPLRGARQRVVEGVETNDPAKMHAIARSIAPGYLRGNTVIFKEKVALYVYKEPPAAAEPAEQAPAPRRPRRRPPHKDGTGRRTTKAAAAQAAVVSRRARRKAPRRATPASQG